jgi:hypothetical protein
MKAAQSYHDLNLTELSLEQGNIITAIWNQYKMEQMTTFRQQYFQMRQATDFLSYRDIGAAFGVAGSTVQYHYDRFQEIGDKEGQVGRPFILTPVEIAEVV